MKRIISIMLVSLLLSLCGCSRFVMLPKEDSELQPKYTEACDLLKEGDYEGAYDLFSQLGDYKDSKTHLSKFAYLPTEILKEDDGMGENIVIYRTRYTYNEKGLLTEGVGQYTNDEGPGYSEKLEYNHKGQLTVNKTESEAGYSTLEFEYNDKGQLIKRVGCTEGANVGGITTYSYGEDSLLKEAVMQSYIGTDTANYQNEQPYHTDKVTYTCDNDGRYIKAESSYGDGGITYTASYNKNGLPIEIKSVTSDSFESVTRFEYGESGLCTSIITPYDRTDYQYSGHDLPVSATYTRDGGVPCKITYSYKLFYLEQKPKFPFFMDEHLFCFEV